MRAAAALAGALLVAAGCGAEVSGYDPVISRIDASTQTTVTAAADVEEESDISQSNPQIRIPRYSNPDFDPAAAVLPQLPSFESESVKVFGPEIGSAADSLEFAFDRFTEATGIQVEYTGSADADIELDELIANGNQPDIAMIPQPARVVSLASNGHLVPMPRLIREQVGLGYDPFWAALGSVEDRLYAVPQSANVKSLVWYRPAVFAANGYEVPTTFGEFEALVDRIRTDGLTPWCIGIASGAASGWPLTDWIEDYMLRFKGPEFYDSWVDHEIAFNDPEVIEVIRKVGAMWFREGNVNGGRDRIDTASWADAATAHANEECVLHRQASFIAGTYRSGGATVGEGQDIDAFYLPTVADSEFGQVVLGAGTFAGALSEDPATLSVISYIAGPDFAENRIRSGEGGYLSAHRLHDTSVYSESIDRKLAEILVSADPFRFDGSDLMPPSIGANVFWRTGTVYAGGTIDVLDFVDEVEALWPR